MMYVKLPDMTAAELRCSREYLGLTQGWMARYLMCDNRRLLRMEMGQEDIPERFVTKVDGLYESTAEVVKDLVSKYRAMVDGRSEGEAELAIYRSDDSYRADRKRKVDYGGKFTAQWHRMVAQRVADAVPGVVLVYKDPMPRKPKPWERGPRKEAVSSP
jgi:hypothetical protein